MKKLIALLSIVLVANAAQAQTEKLEITANGFVGFLTVVVILLALIFFVYCLYMVGLIKDYLLKIEKDEETIAFEQQGFWQRLFQMKPIAYQRMLAHEYDGIQELDNPTPPWFMFLFYSTVGFGLIYMLSYHVLGDGNVQVKEYEEQVAMAKASYEEYTKKTANLINEDNAKALTDAKTLAEGKALFDANCVACHGAGLEGKVGPNLTDEYWIHGGKVKNIFHLIAEGAPQKGMISWKKQLNPRQIQQLTSYIVSKVGSNPPNPKEPQGEKAI